MVVNLYMSEKLSARFTVYTRGILTTYGLVSSVILLVVVPALNICKSVSNLRKK